MPLFWLVLTILALALFGALLGRRKALQTAGGDSRQLHSLPSYYATMVALWSAVPALLLVLTWALLQPPVISAWAARDLLPLDQMEAGERAGAESLRLTEVRRVAEGLDLAVTTGVMSPENASNLTVETTDIRSMLGVLGVALGSDVSADVLKAAQHFRDLQAKGLRALNLLALLLVLGGLIFGLRNSHKDYRARNVVERSVMILLVGAASLAILTTVGIVLSMVFETRNFFGLHSWRDFFFGTTWAPNFRGDSELAILPLLWGTLYISLVALIVAVPTGLFAAIYLAEYASRSMRSFAKPLLEILAGIPTIVYGLFALVTFGPFLLRLFGEGGVLGVNWMSDARSVATAGIVMGIMLIPFVSSLSDDIINAVPQSMRDGSYGLGATKSETIRQVVLPAALPGIVGAILLAASRAIGETMIVVLGAGAIARLSGNPLEALTTITTRIVSQLTGDGDFASPETLVAFALGLTLFVLTLGLNVLALYIVRKYREQYE